MPARALGLLALALSLLGLLGASGPVTFATDVAPGKTSALRLRQVPRGAVLGIRVETSGEIGILVVDGADFRRFPAVVRPLFRGRLDSRVAFSVVAPAPGDYFVLLDNRSGAAARAVNVTVAATAGGAQAGAPIGRALQRKLEEFERKLAQVLVFDPLAIRVAPCGAPRVVTDASGITLCTEYVRALQAALGDRQRASDALLFTFFQELGRALLEQWKHPEAASEDVADEFTTALMVMVGSKDRVRAKAEYFAANPSVAEALAQALRDERHILSIGRARNILGWADDPELVRRWQAVFVPRMQTRMLERLKAEPTAWADLELVEKELATRR